MTKFYNKQEASTTKKEALRVLTILLKEEGVDAVRRVYAETVHEDIQSDYIQKDHLTSSSSICLCRIAGKRCPRQHGCITFHSSQGSHPMDHPSLWNKKGKPFVNIFQPYHLDVEAMRSMVEIADTYHLDISVDARTSWHFPGDTLCVEVHQRDWWKANTSTGEKI